MFTVEYRAEVRQALIGKARADSRITAAAWVGGSAEGAGDRWSDIDLTLGVAEKMSLGEVLNPWTEDLRADFDAVSLFDLPYRSSVYRVFLFPGALQVDLSFTPDAEFGALGPRFALIFGKAASSQQPPQAPPRQHFGLAAHHAVRARYCIERGRLWQAEYWIGELRDHALMLACTRAGLPAGEGRGWDGLPAKIRATAGECLVRAVERDELLRALRCSVGLLLRESAGAHESQREISELLDDVMA